MNVIRPVHRNEDCFFIFATCNGQCAMNNSCCNVPDHKPAKASYVKKEVEDINKTLAEYQKELSRHRLVCTARALTFLETTTQAAIAQSQFPNSIGDPLVLRWQYTNSHSCEATRGCPSSSQTSMLRLCVRAHRAVSKHHAGTK